ncbi:MAG: hypothetical protein IJ560_01670 [Alphaproteobacteria bacterium]|nr:hypothetical protein [Alphaproteobacteria bacterium]
MGQIVSDVTDVLDYKKNKSTAKTQRQQILAQMAADATAKTNLVKKNIAAQRAKYGSGGVATRGMTTDAVLSRIASESGATYDEKRRRNIEKLRNIKTTRPNILKSLINRFDELMS